MTKKASSSTATPSDVSVPKRYVCPICSKVFDSTYALGGHHNSHRTREKLTPIRNRNKPFKFLPQKPLSRLPRPPRPRCTCVCTGACGNLLVVEASPLLSLELSLAVGQTENVDAPELPEVMISPVPEKTELELDLKL